MRPSSGVCRCLSVARWSPRIARKTRFSGVYTVVFIELLSQKLEIGLNWLTFNKWLERSTTIRSDKRLRVETSASETLYVGQFALSFQLIKPNFLLSEGLGFKSRRSLDFL